MIYINASENLLPLEAFHTFPVLKELELAFNGIKTVYVKYGDFKSLEGGVCHVADHQEVHPEVPSAGDTDAG